MEPILSPVPCVTVGDGSQEEFDRTGALRTVPTIRIRTTSHRPGEHADAALMFSSAGVASQFIESMDDPGLRPIRFDRERLLRWLENAPFLAVILDLQTPSSRVVSGFLRTDLVKALKATAADAETVSAPMTAFRLSKG